MRRKLRNVVSLTTAALVAVSAIGYQSFTGNEKTAKADNTKDKETIENTIEDNVTLSTTGEDKEETVYFISDANGQVKKTVVSDWLKNKDGSDKLEDKSDLQNIENVKSDADFEKGKDGEITWKADGEDVYYQGTTDKKAPVDVKVTYYLDNKEIKPEELAGKSGKVKIRFDYTNNQKKTYTEKGKNYEVYVPFTMVSGMVLDNTKFSNVTVSSGKVVTDGDKSVVIGLAFPGLEENLNLAKFSKDLDKDVDFPNYVEVNADVKDFSLGLTLTMGSADLLSQVNLDSTSDSLDDVKDKLNELVSATDKIKDGTSQLKDGLLTLNTSFVKYGNGVNSLVSGVKQLNTGASQLSGNVPALTDGISTLLGGVDKIISSVDGENGAVSGSKQLADGAAAVDAGVGQMISQVDGENGAVNGSKQLADGAAAVDAGVNQIMSQVDGENGAVSGSKQLADGAAAVDAGAKQLADSSNELKTSVDQLANGAAAIDNGLANVQAAYNDRADGTPGLTSGSQAVSDGVNELASQLQSTVNSLKTSVAALSQTITDNNTKIAQCQAVLQGGISPATGQALTETEIQTYTANIQQLSGANAALTSVIQQIQSQLPSEEQQAVMTQKVNALTQGAKNVADGTKQVSAGISQLREQAATPVANVMRGSFEWST